MYHIEIFDCRVSSICLKHFVNKTEQKEMKNNKIRLRIEL